ATEPEAYSCARLIISTLNFDPPPDSCNEFEDPLYDTHELSGLAPRGYNCTLDIKLILSRLVDGSKFLEFKADYGTTLVTGFAAIEGYLVGIVASNGALTHDASLKGSHFVQICNQRNIPLLFLQNTTSQEPLPLSLSKCGRSFDPNFFFLWPNARIGLVDADCAPPNRRDGDGSEDGEEFTALLT
ncbi:unnamed protein product, partial [Staurois parvus]